MRRLLLALIAIMTMLTVRASDMQHTYLTFETTDGAKAFMEMSSLKLTFIGTTLVIGTELFPISNLRKIYFSASDESSPAGIEEVSGDNSLTESVGIYDLQGHQVSKSNMKRGIYIVKTKDKTYKIVFR